MMVWTLVFMIALIYVPYRGECVKITVLRVPRGASHEAPLDCKYDLEGAQLYDVKWYKDGMQFFRCLPNGEVNEFPVDGVKIVHSGYANLGSCQLKLINLDSKSAGEYKCEVSTEGPTFQIAADSAKLRIIQMSRRVQSNVTSLKDDEQNRTTTSTKSNAITAAANEIPHSKASPIKPELFISLFIITVNMFL